MRVFGRSEQSQNVHKAYTWINAVYGWVRKCLIYIVGLRGLEPRTSRLSGPLVRKGSIASYGEFSPVRASRFFRRERERGQKPPPARTQGVHAKAGSSLFQGIFKGSSLTNIFQRKNARINICGGSASTAQQLQAERVANARRELQNFLYSRPS